VQIGQIVQSCEPRDEALGFLVIRIVLRVVVADRIPGEVTDFHVDDLAKKIICDPVVDFPLVGEPSLEYRHSLRITQIPQVQPLHLRLSRLKFSKNALHQLRRDAALLDLLDFVAEIRQHFVHVTSYLAIVGAALIRFRLLSSSMPYRTASMLWLSRSGKPSFQPPFPSG